MLFYALWWHYHCYELLNKHDKCAAVSDVFVFAGSPSHYTDTSEEKDETN